MSEKLAIFISYSHTERTTFVSRLLETLREHGVDVILDAPESYPRGLRPPQTGEEQLEPSPPGDIESFKQAVRVSLIRTVIGKVGGCRREIAEDAVDAAITVVWQHISRGATISKPRAYVVKVAIRTVLRVLEGERRTPPSADVPETEDTAAVQSFRQVELRADIERAMKALPLRMRAILTQHLMGKSYQEIADFFKISPGAVGAQLNRARTRLRLLLDGWERR